jgi:hypothetical protein
MLEPRKFTVEPWRFFTPKVADSRFWRNLSRAKVTVRSGFALKVNGFVLKGKTGSASRWCGSLTQDLLQAASAEVSGSSSRRSMLDFYF